MSQDTISFCRELGANFPQVAGILEDHVEYYEEILPHVFMGDITRYILGDGEGRAAIVGFIENAAGRANEKVIELIAVSFIENIDTREELEKALMGVNGNWLREEWNRQHEGVG